MATTRDGAHPTRFILGVAGLLASTMALSASLGCGDAEQEPDRGDPLGRLEAAEPVPSAEEAYALSVEDLEALHERLSERSQRGEATQAGVEASRQAARIARLVSLKRRDAAWTERARGHLVEASRRRALPGACEASLELARLLAVDASDPQAAYAVAYRTARRFGRDHADCVARARFVTDSLEFYRPGPEELAAIEADPDADDPTARVAVAQEESFDINTWARGRRDVGDAELVQVRVYGAPGGDGPDGNGADVVRVVLIFDGVAVFERGELPADGDLPRRAYLDLSSSGIAESVPRSVPVGGAGLTRVRSAIHEPGTARVVFDLEDDAQYRLFFLSDPFRIVIDFDRRGSSPAVATAAGGARRASTIVIDPGHGGNEFGARHEGLKESELVLDISRRLVALLSRRLPQSRVLVTRTEDRVVSLEERVAFANSVGADLFVSVHLNAADEEVERGGVATFVLDVNNDRQALRLAARENGTTTAEVTELQRLLASLHRQGQVSESRELASLVQRGTLAGARRFLPNLRDRGVKSAMFYVLVGARMPAVLVEASFLNQPEENLQLATPPYRQALAEGMAEGIVRYARGESLPPPAP